MNQNIDQKIYQKVTHPYSPNDYIGWLIAQIIRALEGIFCVFEKNRTILVNKQSLVCEWYHMCLKQSSVEYTSPNRIISVKNVGMF